MGSPVARDRISGYALSLVQPRHETDSSGACLFIRPYRTHHRFVLGVLLLKEHLNGTGVIGYSLVLIGLVLFSVWAAVADRMQ